MAQQNGMFTIRVRRLALAQAAFVADQERHNGSGILG